MLVEKDGIYLANPVNTSIEEKDTGSVQFTGFFNCTHILEGREFVDLQGAQNIYAHLNIVTKAGALNDINVRSLKDSLGWDGASFASLQRDDWGDTQVQLVVGWEPDQNGVNKLKVKYINPKDYKPSGGVEKADPQVIQSLDAKYGSLLRAMGGVKKAAPTNGNGSSPRDSMGKDLAWAAFQAKVDAYGREHPDEVWPQQKRVDKFRELAMSISGVTDKTKITPADWVTIKRQIEADFSPATGELIMF